jgi:hypothetical protein
MLCHAMPVSRRAYRCDVARACAGVAGDADECAFHAHFNVAAFDAEFEGAYREHMFRFSALVPSSIHVSREDVAAAGSVDAALARGVPVVPVSHDLGALAASVQSFGDAPLLRVRDLHRVAVAATGDAAVEERLRRGIKSSGLRQY